MREIKFRAWDNEKNKYTYNFHCYDFRYHTNDGENFKLVCSGLKDNGDYYELGLEQFTGLKDKNDAEIYEGDILEYVNGTIFQVVYENTAYLMKSLNVAGMYWELAELISDIRYKIIGNIHKNPELLT